MFPGRSEWESSRSCAASAAVGVLLESQGTEARVGSRQKGRAKDTDAWFPNGDGDQSQMMNDDGLASRLSEVPRGPINNGHGPDE